jgi:hypothetical protein
MLAVGNQEGKVFVWDLEVGAYLPPVWCSRVGLVSQPQPLECISALFAAAARVHFKPFCRNRISAFQPLPQPL